LPAIGVTGRHTWLIGAILRPDVKRAVLAKRSFSQRQIPRRDAFFVFGQKRYSFEPRPQRIALRVQRFDVGLALK
jgi:hypothetical protein